MPVRSSPVGESLPTLDYSTKPTPYRRLEIGKFILLATVFAVSHCLREYATAFILEFKFHVLGAPRTEYQRMKLNDRFENDMIEEVFIALFAVFIIVAMQVLYWLRRRWRGSVWRHRAWPTAILYGVLFCWLRWAMWWARKRFSIEISDTADFWIAMLLSLFVGLSLARTSGSDFDAKTVTYFTS